MCVCVGGLRWYLSPLCVPFSLFNMHLLASEPIHYSAAMYKAPTHLVLILYHMDFPNMAAEWSLASYNCWIIITTQNHWAKTGRLCIHHPTFSVS